MISEYRIETLTPIFSYGADPWSSTGRGREKIIHEGTPEIRPASIRGQLRWWMELRGFERRLGSIFGSIADNDEGTASKVVVRVANIEGKVGQRRSTQQHHWSQKTCFLPGTTFTLSILERMNRLSEDDRKVLTDTIECWLALGTLGGRGTRGAGSLQDTNRVFSEKEWADRIPHLLNGTSARVWLGRTSFKTESDARHTICETLKEEAFGPKAQPLGGIHPRKTSPLRMRVVRFTDADPDQPYRIAFLWTLSEIRSLENAVQILKSGGKQGQPKKIGRELEEAIPVK